jgi:hypothetical protein
MDDLLTRKGSYGRAGADRLQHRNLGNRLRLGGLGSLGLIGLDPLFLRLLFRDS